MNEPGKSWVEVSERRLKENFKRLRRSAGEGVALLSVVKADAYGHGATLCAPVLAGAGTEWLGVTDAAEGVLVQAALRGRASWREHDEAAGEGRTANDDAVGTGVDRPGMVRPGILILCGCLAEDAATIVAHGLTAVVWTRWQMEALAAAMRGRPGVSEGQDPLPVHLELDTGMSRQGVEPGMPLARMLGWFRESPSLRLDGVLTHFASAEVVRSRQTSQQRQRFAHGLRQVREAGFRPGWVHAGNTSALDNTSPAWGEESHVRWLRHMAGTVGARPMARAGLGLYGWSLPLQEAAELREVEVGRGLQLAAAAEARGREDEPLEGALQGLAPAMTWKTRVIGISEVEAGACVGYNATFVAPRPMRLALLPVGYADGMRRELSGSDGGEGAWVMVGVGRAPIVGRVSMNLTTVDVTGMEDVAEGDVVTLLGEGISAEDHARLAGTIPYEILCGVRPAGRVLV